MLGDSYGAAVVEALSRKELEAMDREAGVKKEARGEDEEALIGLYKTESGLETGSNGSSVKVREVHLLRRCYCGVQCNNQPPNTFIKYASILSIFTSYLMQKSNITFLLQEILTDTSNSDED